jgi:hypothetical protein
MRRIATLTMALAIVSACKDEPQPPGMPDDRCGAAALHALVGQTEGIVAGAKAPGPVRIIRPGMAVTMDYSPTRLNIEIGTDGRILRLSCG